VVAIGILLGAFLVLLAINVPVAFSMVLACLATLLWQGTVPTSVVTLKLYSGIDTFPFLAIPLFILAGGLMEHGGISERLVRLARNLVGHIKGGAGVRRGGGGDLLLRDLGVLRRRRVGNRCPAAPLHDAGGLHAPPWRRPSWRPPRAWA